MIFFSNYSNDFMKTLNDTFNEIEPFTWINDTRKNKGSIEIDLPGVDKKSIKIRNKNNQIEITAKHKTGNDVKRFIYGNYPIKKAEYIDGVLILSLKEEESNTITVS